MLWAWERPVDLRDLDPKIGVAFLAQAISVGTSFTIHPRRNPLRVSPATPLVAVTRLESTRAQRAQLSADEVDRLATVIVDSASLPRVIGIQIDFDAVASERDFYRALLERVRKRLPSQIPLSITALASWCTGDRWLDGVPVDESVAMLFQLGVDDAPYTREASSSGSTCHSLGLSLDEPIAVQSNGRRVYVFNDREWTSESVRRAASLAR